MKVVTQAQAEEAIGLVSKFLADLRADPDIDDLARAWATLLLRAADVDDMLGCPLCQS